MYGCMYVCIDLRVFITIPVDVSSYSMYVCIRPLGHFYVYDYMLYMYYNIYANMHSSVCQSVCLSVCQCICVSLASSPIALLHALVSGVAQPSNGRCSISSDCPDSS